MRIDCIYLARYRLRLALAVSLAPGLALGAPVNDGSVELDPVVVSATRTEKTQADAPLRVEVIGRKELEARHARTLTEALETVPGLQLQQIHGKAGYELSLQGLSGDQVLVLIDGMPITASTGSTVDLSQYALADVVRIEVIKGASSALYGSAAMGGVINVITEGGDARRRLSLSADLGSYGEQNPSGHNLDAARRHLQAVSELGDAALRLRLSGDWSDDQGFTTDPDGWAQQGDAAERLHGALRLDGQPLPSLHSFAELGAFTETTVSRYDYYAPPNNVQQQKTEDVERLRVSGGGLWMLPADWALTARSLAEHYASAAQEVSAGDVTDRRDSKQLTQQLSLQLDAPPWRRQRWTLGADHVRGSLRQQVNGTSEVSGDEVGRHSWELFAQDDLMLSQNLELVPGFRAQHDSDFGSAFAPKLAARWRVVDAAAQTLTLRASIGRGYRVPNLKERYYRFDHSSLGYIVLGNPELQPETSSSLQLGATLRLGQRGEMDLNLFHNDIRDLIQIDEDNTDVVNGIAYYRYQNLDRARTQGVETLLQWRALRPLQLQLGYTLTATEDLATGNPLTHRPRHSGRLGLDWTPTDGSSLLLRQRWQGAEFIDSLNQDRSPAWSRIDLRLNQRLNPQWALYAGVDNLLDDQRDFADSDDFSPIEGRQLYLGARFQWHPAAHSIP